MPLSSGLSSPNPASNTPEALTEQAEMYYAQRQWTLAMTACQQAIQLQPDFALAYVTLGNIQQAQGKINAAINSYQQALKLNPNLPQAHANLGSMLYKQGKIETAIMSYRQAISLKPDFAAVYSNLAKALRQQGKEAEAQICEQRGVEFRPQTEDDKSLFNRGNQFAQQGKLEEAISAWQQAINLNPNFAEAYCQIGMIRRYQGKYKEAIAQFEKALDLQPNCIPAHQHLCGIYRDSSDLKAARNAVNQYRQNCDKTHPIMTAIYSISTHQVSGLNQIAKEQFLDLELKLDTYLETATDIEVKALYSNFLFSLPYLRDNRAQNSRLNQKVSQQYVRKILQKLPIQPNLVHLRGTPSTPLKIGILSNHFNRHAVGWCSLDIIQALSQLNSQIYLYCTDRLNRDDRTPLFEQVSQKFYIPKNYPNGLPSSSEIIEEIQKDNIDILLDLDALSMPIHTEILYAKPATVCLSWLGFDAPFISSNNYFLCDSYTHPEGRDQYYTEKLVRMPDSFVAVSGFNQVEVDAATLRKIYRISDDQIVYLCVAPGRKFNRDLVEAQIAILKQVPQSILLHKAVGDTEVFCSAYRKACEAAGVSLHRVKFMERFPTEEEHRQIYTLADVLLDSYPYNGGTHTLEALWFNVPVVTRVGEQFLSRMGYSFLQGVGVEAGVAKSWEEYINWGVRLGKDAELRKSIQNQLLQSKSTEHPAPLWNPVQFANNLYQILEQLLKNQV